MSESTDDVKSLDGGPVASKMGIIRIGLKRALTSLSLLSSDTLLESEKDTLKPTISRPLAGLTRRQLRAKVYDLANHYGILDDIDMLQKGALVAQHGADWKQVRSELTEEEYQVLLQVEMHPWRQITLPLLLTVAAASCGAITLGWDQGVLSGATLHYPKALGIDPDINGPHQAYFNWLTGIVSSGPFLGAAGFSVWLSDSINHHYGRRGALFVASIFLLAGPLGSAFVQTWIQLLVCRILLGLGIGFLEVTAPVFAAESAPFEVRGAMTINFQVFTAFGILLGSSANLAMEKVSHNWRYMLGSPLIPVPLLLTLIWYSPESARWYLKWGKIKEAYESLKRLRHHKLLAARDLYLMHVQIAQEQAAMGGSRNMKRFAELFYKNRVRQSTIASCVVHAAQVLSGINIVCLFSSTIFTELTEHWGDGGGNGTTALVGPQSQSKMKALWGSWGFGLVNFLFTFPAVYTIDRLGRRTLMLLTLPQLFWTLLACGLSFLSSSHPSTELGLVCTFIYLFTAFYSAGIGPIAFLYSAEAAPQTHRELSVALAACVNNGLNALLSITFFRMRQAFGTIGVFEFYAAMNLLMWVLVFATVPETKQLSLEQLDSVFARSNREFFEYQFKHQLPYVIKRYVCFRKTETLVPLDVMHHIDHL